MKIAKGRIVDRSVLFQSQSEVVSISYGYWKKVSPPIGISWYGLCSQVYKF